MTTIHFVRYTPEQLTDLLGNLGRERMQTAHAAPPSLIDQQGGYDAWMAGALRRWGREVAWYSTELSKHPADRLYETATFWRKVIEEEEPITDDYDARTGRELLLDGLYSIVGLLDTTAYPGMNVSMAFDVLVFVNDTLRMLGQPIPDQLELDDPLWADVSFPKR